MLQVGTRVRIRNRHPMPGTIVGHAIVDAVLHADLTGKVGTYYIIALDQQVWITTMVVHQDSVIRICHECGTDLDDDNPDHFCPYGCAWT